MLTLVAATMLSMAAMKADPMDNARKAFNNCMIETHNKGVTDKLSPSSFTKAADEACMPERTAYRDVLIKSERSYGSSQKDAEKFASEEVQMIVDSVVSSFNENVENGAKLTPEK
jgi:hypothetical protein